MLSKHALRLRLLALALLSLLLLSAYDWPQFGFNASHSADNTQETLLRAGNVGELTRFLHVTLPSTADGAPAYLSNVSTISGTLNLVFLTTRDGHILALDGLSGATVWSHQYGPNGCKINHGSSDCYTTSSPAVDPDRRYVYSYGLDGYVHKYQVSDGAETLTGGWPEPATLKGFDEKGSSALSLASTASGAYLYVTNGGYPGDAGDYQGHVTAINLATGGQHVFNSMCSNQPVHLQEKPGTPDCAGQKSAIWARAGVVYDPDTGRVYMATGNGTYNPALHDWGDTVFALKPDGTGSGGDPLDAYTPTNYQALQNSDADLGSTAPALLPNSGKYPHLAVQSGKDGLLRLINLDNLSGHGGPGFTGGEVFSMSVPQGGEVLTMPAVWVNPADSRTWVFVANGSGLSALKLALDGGGHPSLATQWQIGNGGTSPIVAGGVLFYASSNNLWALNPLNHAVLWHNTQIGSLHWESPIVVDGRVYMTDNSSRLSGFWLPLPHHIYLPVM